MNHAKEELDMEKIGLSAIALLLCGCSAAGVVISNDPWQNLAQADVLIEHGRATAAEKLIVEARTFAKKTRFAMPWQIENMPCYSYLLPLFLLGQNTIKNKGL
ncbi:hypothetical protein [Aeromonas sp. 602658]|uniref:hypothetical protein n=1 Tax=Aeromonas sp. 602658 TaxID=2712043 RepID=UPI003BA3D395